MTAHSKHSLMIMHKEDGCFLSFDCGEVGGVMLNLNAIADQRGPKTKMIILEWISRDMINEVLPKVGVGFPPLP